ncbi:MAG: gliding-motility protein MglA [Bdellovibrionales bacterium]
MPIINNNAKEIHCKIIYYGPLGSGKNSCLQFIKNHSSKDKVRSFSLPLDMPLEALVIDIGRILGLKTSFHIYSIPQLTLEEKKLLVRGVDGIVFVANSATDFAQKNLQSLQELDGILKEQEVNIFKIPMVFQYHKRDLDAPLSIQDLRTSLNKYNCKDFESSIKQEQNILEPLKHLFKSVITSLKSGETL